MVCEAVRDTCTMYVNEPEESQVRQIPHVLDETWLCSEVLGAWLCCGDAALIRSSCILTVCCSPHDQGKVMGKEKLFRNLSYFYI